MRPISRGEGGDIILASPTSPSSLSFAFRIGASCHFSMQSPPPPPPPKSVTPTPHTPSSLNGGSCLSFLLRFRGAVRVTGLGAWYLGCLVLALLSQHTSAYVSIRQHTCWDLGCLVLALLSQHTSAYVSIRQHTSAYLVGSRVLLSIAQSAYVSVRQNTSAYLLGSRVLILSIPPNH
jgi:hypothetical protein